MSKSLSKLSRDELLNMVHELERKNKLLEESQAITKAGGWEYDVINDHLAWTSEVYQIYDLKPSETDPLSVDFAVSFVDESYLPKLMDLFNNAIEKGAPYDIEFKFTNASGKDLWIRTIGEAEIENGKVVRVFGNIIDITQKKKASLALQQSEEKYRTLFNYVPDGILIADNKSYYLDVNPSMCKMLGYEKEEIVGAHAVDIVTFPEMEYIDPALEEITSNKEYSREWEFKRKDGFTFHADVNVTVLPDESLIALVRDITDRKVVENKIRRLSADLKRLLDVSQELTSNLDLESLMQSIVNQAVDIKDMDTGAIYLIEENTVFIKAASPPIPKDFPDEFRKAELIDHPHLAKSIDNNNIVIIYDTEHAILTESEKIICESRGLKSIIYLPVLVKERPIGALILGTINRLHKFEKEELEIFKSFSSIVGLALYNALLYQQSLQSEQRLKSAQEIAKIGDFIWNIETGKVTWSDAMYKLLEFNQADEIDISKVNEEIHHPDDLERVSKWLTNSINSGKNELEALEYKIIKKNGKIIDVRTVGQIQYENGKPKRVFGAVQDITEQKKLQSQVTLINKALDNSLNGFDIIDSNGKFIYVNKAYVKMWGYESASEIIGTSRVRHCADPNIPEKIITVLHEKGSCEIEFEARKKDGSVFNVLMYAIMQYDTEGNEVYTGTSLDITERKLNEKRLRERNEFIETILDNLPIGLAVNLIDDGKTHYMNKQFENIYGWPRNEIIDIENFFKNVYPNQKYRDEITSRVMSDIKSGIPERMNWENIKVTRKDGEKRIVSAKNIPLPDQNFMISTVQDETEKKNALNNFIKAQERYKTLFENQPTIIWIEDLSEVKKYIDNLKQKGISNLEEYFTNNPEQVKLLASRVKIREINQTSVELLEAESREEVIQNIQYYFDTDESWDIFKDELVNLANGKIIYENDIPIRTLKGNRKYLHLKLVVQPDNINDFKEVIVTFSDITETRKYIDELKKSREQIRTMFTNLDRILEDERKMLATELHDELGQVLTSIKMNLSLLNNSIIKEDYTEDYIKSEIRDMTNIIDSSNVKMRKLIHFLRPEYLDNLGLIVALKHHFEEIEKRTNLKINFEYETENIELDPNYENAIFKVIQEALTNILKHAEAKKVQVIFKQTEEIIEIEIIDDGIGMNISDQNKQNSFGILGMKERLHSINSSLALKSDPGNGTRLSFTVNV